MGTQPLCHICGEGTRGGRNPENGGARSDGSKGKTTGDEERRQEMMGLEVVEAKGGELERKEEGHGKAKSEKHDMKVLKRGRGRATNQEKKGEKQVADDRGQWKESRGGKE